MKVNMNVIVGGSDDELNNILSAARTIRKEMKSLFESFEIEALQKMDICVCLSGNISKYYSESGIYQASYYLKTKKFIVYVHFCSNEWKCIMNIFWSFRISLRRKWQSISWILIVNAMKI